MSAKEAIEKFITAVDRAEEELDGVEMACSVAVKERIAQDDLVAARHLSDAGDYLRAAAGLPGRRSPGSAIRRCWTRRWQVDQRGWATTGRRAATPGQEADRFGSLKEVGAVTEPKMKEARRRRQPTAGQFPMTDPKGKKESIAMKNTSYGQWREWQGLDGTRFKVLSPTREKPAR
jgi:hypothetical protein